LVPVNVSVICLPVRWRTCWFSDRIRSRDRTVVAVSRFAAVQNSWPAVAGFSPPSAPDVLTMFRRPFVSGFAAVVEFGFAM
jgi:hypothetical protein